MRVRGEGVAFNGVKTRVDLDQDEKSYHHEHKGRWEEKYHHSRTAKFSSATETKHSPKHWQSPKEAETGAEPKLNQRNVLVRHSASECQRSMPQFTRLSDESKQAFTGGQSDGEVTELRTGWSLVYNALIWS